MSEPRRFEMAGHFISEMGFTHQVEEGLARGWGWHAPELSVPGTEFPHASVMLTFADILLGLLSGFASAPRISLTVDLRAQVIYAPPFGPIEIDGHLLKTGRTTTVGETTFSEPGAELPFAISFGTFIGSPRPVDVRDSDPARTAELPKMLSLTQPFTERLGIRIVEPGVADADHRPDLLNSSDSIQGGVLALIAEVAAQSLATAEAGRTFAVDDLDIRYLRAARVGPARAQARVLHLTDTRATVAVEIRDLGGDNRIVSYASALCRDVDASSSRVIPNASGR